MHSIRFRAETPPKERWLIFDCSLLTIEELKGALEELRNSPSLCDTDIDHVIAVYREKKSEVKKAERDRKSKGSITSEGRPKSHQKEKKTYEKTPRHTNFRGTDQPPPAPPPAPPINPNFQLFPEIKLPNISWIFGANKGINEKQPITNIPIMKKPPKKGF